MKGDMMNKLDKAGLILELATLTVEMEEAQNAMQRMSGRCRMLLEAIRDGGAEGDSGLFFTMAFPANVKDVCPTCGRKGKPC